MLIRTGDTVEVRSGNSRGTRARVLSVDSANGKLVVEGVNRVVWDLSGRPVASVSVSPISMCVCVCVCLPVCLCVCR